MPQTFTNHGAPQYDVPSHPTTLAVVGRWWGHEAVGLGCWSDSQRRELVGTVHIPQAYTQLEHTPADMRRKRGECPDQASPQCTKQTPTEPPSHHPILPHATRGVVRGVSTDTHRVQRRHAKQRKAAGRWTVLLVSSRQLTLWVVRKSKHPVFHKHFEFTAVPTTLLQPLQAPHTPLPPLT